AQIVAGQKSFEVLGGHGVDRRQEHADVGPLWIAILGGLYLRLDGDQNAVQVAVFYVVGSGVLRSGSLAALEHGLYLRTPHVGVLLRAGDANLRPDLALVERMNLTAPRIRDNGQLDVEIVRLRLSVGSDFLGRRLRDALVVVVPLQGDTR